MLAELERHPAALAALGPALAPGGSPSHAYLFHGPGGAGKRTAARAVAATLLSAGEADPAGAHARALAGVHPDLTWVSPSGAHELLVSDVDEPVVAAASRTPFESRRRVFVIESVDRLGDEAANRMLKTLEEPAAFVHLILITDRLADVIPTIRSRCQLVRFDAPSEDELTAELRADGVDSQMAAAYARLGFGDASRTRELAAAEGQALRDSAERFITAVLAGEAADAAPCVELLKAVRARGERVSRELEEQKTAELELYPSRERKRAETEWNERIRRRRRRVETGALDTSLSLIAAWLLDLAAVGFQAPDLVRNVDRMERLGAAPGMKAGGGDDTARENGPPPHRPTLPAITRAVELVEDTRQRFQLNVTEELACEALAYRLQELLAG
jgi:DNA polymerase-3 subunit delta'